MRDTPAKTIPAASAYRAEPDYSYAPAPLDREQWARVKQRLEYLYGDGLASKCATELERILRVHAAHRPSPHGTPGPFDPAERFTERDCILITYGDLIRGEEPSPLTTLGRFLDTYLEGTVNTVHILPFFPYSSDRGFSVIDFETVDPNLGTWEDIHRLGERYRLMFDGVVNHVSAESRWFREFRNDKAPYRDFFITFESPDQLPPEQRQLIFRPRTSDILTRVETLTGERFVWTTFSADQVDLNYQNPEVLLRVVEILLSYVRHGADIIRLDAITYLWAEPGTRCVHLEQTHQIVKLLRDVLDIAAPEAALITETNVPHAENISYFGDGGDEAQMVYNFALPPLVLHTLHQGDATALSDWAGTLERVSPTATYFNFLDSHDGIGVMGVRGILEPEEIDELVSRVKRHGGLVSCKSTADGGEEPYELNITWYSALNRKDDGEDTAFHVHRFVASRVIALVLRGVPGIYLHSLIGTRNDVEAVLATDSKRDINRTVIDAAAIRRALADPLSKVSRINRELGRLIKIRTGQRAFHPNGAQRVLRLSPHVFAVLRTSPEGDRHVLALVNVSDAARRLKVPVAEVGVDAVEWHDLVSGMEWLCDEGVLHLSLMPYDTAWLVPAGEVVGEAG